MEESIVVCVCNADASVVPLGYKRLYIMGPKSFENRICLKLYLLHMVCLFNFTFNLDLFQKACRNNWTLLKVSSFQNVFLVKFIYSEKATKFCKIFTLLLTGTT